MQRSTSTGAVARGTSLRVATGETFHTAGQFFTLAAEGSVGIWQPEPMPGSVLHCALSVPSFWQAPVASVLTIRTQVAVPSQASLNEQVWPVPIDGWQR